MRKNYNNKTLAFTLAEVLITLGIIGVVAALTIPTLIENANERANIVALKKAYSTLSNAYTLAVQENWTPDNWNLIAADDAVGAINILSNLAPYLKITKNCGNGTGCFPNDYWYLNGNKMSSVFDSINFIAKAQLADGSLLFTQVSNKDCKTSLGSSPALGSICGQMAFDINGFKKPNKLGVDYFYFYITKIGIIPIGTSLQDAAGSTFADTCKDKSSGTAYGWGCAAWVIYNDNMDYLHCNYLDWSGKTKCD